MSPSTIAATAPGKIVLWGEYAVLTGAPALVMAVNRRAACRLQPAVGSWRVRTRGHAASTVEVTAERLLAEDAPANGLAWTLLWHVLASLKECGSLSPATLPAGMHVHLDTDAFHAGGAKLGLGSSAALCVALHGALCRLLKIPADLETALAAHRRLQAGASTGSPGSRPAQQGSGIDVAAAWFGGTLKFRRGDSDNRAESWPLPASMAVGFVWTGVSASTPEHLARLQRWLDAGSHRELEDLARLADRLFLSAQPVDDLADYVDALRALDGAAELGIFSDAHRKLGQLAIDAGVVYKPCGAGGGDIGAAFASTTRAIEEFSARAAASGFLPLALEIEPHGLEVTG